jgi:DNA-binding transcriptional MerR regulator
VDKAPEAFRTITEAAEELDLPAHVLRFWEGKFAQLRPLKRAGGRRLYRPDDIALLRGIRDLIYADGQPIKAVQKLLREQGAGPVRARGRDGQEGLAPVPAPRRPGSPGSAHDLPPWEDEGAGDSGDTEDDGSLDAGGRADAPADLDSFDDGLDDGITDGDFAFSEIPSSVQFNAVPEPAPMPRRDNPAALPGPEASADSAVDARDDPVSSTSGAGAVAPGFALRRALARLEEARAVLRQVERPRT